MLSDNQFIEKYNIKVSSNVLDMIELLSTNVIVDVKNLYMKFLLS